MLTEGQQSLYNAIIGDNYLKPIVDIENKNTRISWITIKVTINTNCYQ